MIICGYVGKFLVSSETFPHGIPIWDQFLVFNLRLGEQSWAIHSCIAVPIRVRYGSMWLVYEWVVRNGYPNFQQMASGIEVPGGVSSRISQQEIPKMNPMQNYQLHSIAIIQHRPWNGSLQDPFWQYDDSFVGSESMSAIFCVDQPPSVFLKRKISTEPPSDWAKGKYLQCSEWFASMLGPLFQLVPWIGSPTQIHKRDLFRFIFALSILSHGRYQACTIFGEAMSVLRECRKAC